MRPAALPRGPAPRPCPGRTFNCAQRHPRPPAPLPTLSLTGRGRQALVNVEQRAAEIDLDRLEGWPGLHLRLCEDADADP